MDAYDVAQIVLAALVMLYGLVMIAFPKACTKKTLRDNPNAVAKMRKCGILELIAGAILLLVVISL